MTDTEARLAEEGMRVEKADPFAPANRPWRVSIISEDVILDHIGRHVLYGVCLGDNRHGPTRDERARRMQTVTTAVNAYSPVREQQVRELVKAARAVIAAEGRWHDYIDMVTVDRLADALAAFPEAE